MVRQREILDPPSIEGKTQWPFCFLRERGTELGEMNVSNHLYLLPTARGEP